MTKRMSKQKKLVKTKRVKIDSKFSTNSKVVLWNGDTLDFIKKVPDGTFKLIITSPPYNVGKEYEKKTEIQKYLKSMESMIDEFVRVLHPEGSICWQVGNYVDKGEIYPLDIFFYNMFKDKGLKLRNRIIWHFGHGLHARKRFSGRYETILWFTKTDNYTFNLDAVRVPAKYPNKRHYKGKKKGKLSGNPLGKNPSDFWEKIKGDWENEVWKIPNVKSNHPEKTIHPCQYPVELVERCILALTNESDFVFDPFAGVGSTMIACVKNKRRVAGCEKEKQYAKITKERIKKFYDGNLKLRPIGKPIHVPNGKEAKYPKEWKQRIKEQSQLLVMGQEG